MAAFTTTITINVVRQSSKGPAGRARPPPPTRQDAQENTRNQHQMNRPKERRHDTRSA